mmetsp:Transcript_132834/g.331403  ORF Transcript_132834/g.331403 Transcript_132834/m.331403 type:complete len:232 (-) Transcript_132834:565-1260(-)
MSQAIFAEGAFSCHGITTPEPMNWRKLWPAWQQFYQLKNICRDVRERVYDLAWLDLRQHGAQCIAVGAIHNAPHLHLRGGTIYQACRESVCIVSLALWRILMEVEAYHVLGTSTAQELRVHKCSIGIDFTWLPLDAARPNIGPTFFPLLLFHNPLHLLYHHNLVTCINQLFGVVVFGHLREAYMRFPLTHPLQVANSLSDEGIVIEDLIEFANFEQGNLVKMCAFQFPVLQ